MKIFVSKQKSEVKAHKIMLLNVSSFFKDLFETYELDSYKIVLPHFSTDVIQAFIQFFYTGESCLEERWIDEFVCLCQEFKCDKIPVISELIKNHRAIDISSFKEEQAEEMIHDKSTENLTITRILEAPKEEMEFDEYFENNDNVETIFFNENECNDGEFINRPAASSSSCVPKPVDEEREIKEEYLNVQYIEENPHFELIQDSEKLKDQEESELSTDQKQNEISMVNLEMAVEDVKGGMSLWNAHKKYGINKSSIIRQLQKDNESRKQIKKNVAAPSITFPNFALAMNLTQLREEQNRFKIRLQEAINSCRDSGNSAKKASKMFGVPVEAIERNLRGFKNLN